MCCGYWLVDLFLVIDAWKSPLDCAITMMISMRFPCEEFTCRMSGFSSAWSQSHLPSPPILTELWTRRHYLFTTLKSKEEASGKSVAPSRTQRDGNSVRTRVANIVSWICSHWMINWLIDALSPGERFPPNSRVVRLIDSMRIRLTQCSILIWL